MVKYKGGFMPKLEELTLSQLKEKALALGLTEGELKSFSSKATVIATIRAIEKVKPVATLNPTENPKEIKEDSRRWETKVDRMRAFLADQPTVRVLVPLEGDEKQGVVKEVNGQMVTVSGAVWSKTFNGYRVCIPKGKYVNVAQSIADNIEQEYHQTTHAGDQWKLDRVKSETGELVSKQLT